MKVLLINGSPKKEGNTYIALHEVQKTLEADGIVVGSQHGILGKEHSARQGKVRIAYA